MEGWSVNKTDKLRTCSKYTRSVDLWSVLGFTDHWIVEDERTWVCPSVIQHGGCIYLYGVESALSQDYAETSGSSQWAVVRDTYQRSERFIVWPAVGGWLLQTGLVCPSVMGLIWGYQSDPKMPPPLMTTVRYKPAQHKCFLRLFRVVFGMIGEERELLDAIWIGGAGIWSSRCLL